MATATAVKKYEYEARDAAGKIRKDSMEAPSSAAVASRLRERGYTVLSVDEAGGKGLNADITIPGLGEKIGLKDIAIMSRQLATMINAGLSLLRSMQILTDQTENKALQKVLAEVRTDVETGKSFSMALGRHPGVFPPIMINMVKAGEVGGFLDSVLVSIAENFEKEVALRNKIKSAMTYPVVVFCIAILGVAAMLLFIVPVFATMFEDLGGELPFATQVLVTLSDVLKIAAIPLVIAIVLFAVWWGKNKHRYEVREKVEPVYLKLPIFGKLIQKIAVARFTRNLGAMVRSGVPILQALDIVGQASGNVVIERATKDVQNSVRRGDSLAGPLAAHKVFPPMVVQMISVGEDTGALDTMLDKIADFYDQEVEATTEQLTSLIEPLMIAVLGSLIGGMVIALYMPIFKVFDLIG
ncbi:type II secretion system F family protein [Demequina sp. SYSU T00068]|uniref:type II secretion system F family protein n=1 Tax=Demequina lignilytica TaxID=3051663 RepID=UPI0026034379|nr:type II secretion system F family protein [Demequina sp. SYSU T00068]MDN4489398.1 type II secretion system F family protein [Demequina sp. SYSU T00068]